MDKLPLHIREWDCPQCGRHNSRDGNAAINLKAEGIKDLIDLGLIELIDDPWCGEGIASHQKQKPVPQDADTFCGLLPKSSNEALEKGMEQQEEIRAVSREIFGSMKQEAAVKSI